MKKGSIRVFGLLVFVLWLATSKKIFSQNDTLKPGQVIYYVDTSASQKNRREPAKQEVPEQCANQCLYFQLYGNSCSIGSLNFERCISKKNGRRFFNIRVGGLYYPDPKDEINNVIFIMGHWTSANAEPVHFDFGIGQILNFETRATNNSYLGLTMSIGLRYQPYKRGIFGQVAYTPTFYYQAFSSPAVYQLTYLMNCGFSLGYSF